MSFPFLLILSFRPHQMNQIELLTWVRSKRRLQTIFHFVSAFGPCLLRCLFV